jgi:hypothetical protein
MIAFVFGNMGKQNWRSFLPTSIHATPRSNSPWNTPRRKFAFLDTIVRVNQTKLETDLFCKPTDSHNYLMYSSAHPKACKNSIPFSQFLRIKRICKNIQDFDRHVINFVGHFLRRGYPINLLEEAAIKARRLDRQKLLYPTPKDKNTTKKNILVTTYHPTDRSLQDVVQKNWDLLGKSTATAFIHENRPMVGYRRPQNLKDLLVRADVRLKPDTSRNPTATINIPENNSAQKPKKLVQTTLHKFFTTQGESITSSSSTGDLTKSQGNPRASTSLTMVIVKPKTGCTNPKCKFCPFLDKSGTISCHFTGQTFIAKYNVTCHSSNLIYGITCKRCGLQYVGQTKRRLHQRLQEHLRSINQAILEKSKPATNPNFKIQPVGAHFSKKDHLGTKDLKIQVLDFINLPPKSERAKEIRLRVEKKWIHLLRCPAPHGMNIFD